MKLLTRLLAFGLLALALPAALPAQWAIYNDSGWPHNLLDAPGGGWVIASERNIFRLSPSGGVVWGQGFDLGTSYAFPLKAWSTPDGGVAAAAISSDGAGPILFKLSAAGSVEWQKTYAVAGGAFGLFCPMPDGGTAMAGGLDTQFLLCRLDAGGDVAWQRSYQTGFLHSATTVIATSDGGVLVVGAGRPAETGPPESELWVLKITAAGEIDWQKLIGGAADDAGEFAYQTADGGYLIAGRSASFDAEGRTLFWLLKLSPAGAILKQLTLDCQPGGLGRLYMERAENGPYVAVMAPSQDELRIVVVMIGDDGAIIREKPYDLFEAVPYITDVMPTEDGGCLLSAAYDWDSLVMKLLPSGEIGWQRIYGSDLSPDRISMLGRAAGGGFVLAGDTSSWGGLQNALWVMRTAADGSIGPNYPFIADANIRPLEAISTQTEISATVTDVAAVAQDPGLTAQAANLDFAPWGPTTLPALGRPLCTLNIRGGADSGTISPAAGDHVYATGAIVQLRATPQAEHVFEGWSGNISAPAGLVTFVMDGDKDVVASFRFTGHTIIDDLKEHFGCFIATAAYGDPAHPDVQVLRDFRDRYLMKSRLGRGFVKLYYRYSPPAARFVEKHPVLRAVSRILLRPAVALSRFLLQLDP